MEHLHFSIHINAPRERVWEVLWGGTTYTQWTRPFGEGGRAETDWKQGSHVHFLSADDEGMYALIERKEENAFMGFKHLGMVQDGKEVPPDASTHDWHGAREEYMLTQRGNGTELVVDMDVRAEDKASFQKMFPDALGIVKDLSEK